MSRWIDADALIRYGKRDTLVYWEDIEDAPSIDLVICAECEKNDTRNCPFYSGGWIHSDDDFCSYGVRKEGE